MKALLARFVTAHSTVVEQARHKRWLKRFVFVAAFSAVAYTVHALFHVEIAAKMADLGVEGLVAVSAEHFIFVAAEV